MGVPRRKGKPKKGTAAAKAAEATKGGEGSTGDAPAAPAPAAPPSGPPPSPAAPPPSGDQAAAEKPAAEKPAGEKPPAEEGPGPGIDARGISMVIRRYLPQVRTCYERELKNDNTLSGTVEVQFTIGADGRVREARHVGGTLRSDAVGGCVTGLVKAWRFPKPAGGRADLIYPFSFYPY